MNLTQLIELARFMTPGAKEQVVSATIIELLANAGAKEVAARSLCLKTSGTFDVVADQSEYTISSILPTFIVPDKPGLWWNAGTSDTPDFKVVNPRTTKWLDENKPKWRDLESDDPIDYVIEGNKIIVVPAPDTSLSDGFKMYFGERPSPMTSGTDYPFGGDYPRFDVFDIPIALYCRWKILPSISKETPYLYAEKDFEREMVKAISLFNRRPDIASSDSTRFRGERIGR